MIRVLVADDHALVRDGLRHILQNASGFEVAGEARDSASTIALLRGTDANVPVLGMASDTALVRYAMRHKLFDDPDKL